MIAPVPTKSSPLGTLRDVIGVQLGQVIADLGLDPAATTVFDRLTRESLAGIAGTGPMPRFSTINNDGMPFQYAVSLGGRRPGLAYLTEVGVPGSSIPARIDLTRSRLGEVLPMIGLGGAADDLDRGLRAVLPPSVDELATWHGGIWIAVGCAGRGIGLKVYVNGRRQVADVGWQAMIRLLRMADRPRSAAWLAGIVPRLPGSNGVAGVALDLAPTGLGGLKAYTRLDAWRPDFLAEVVGRAGHEGASGPLELFRREMDVPGGARPGSLVLSLEFADDESEADIKLDACAHCRFTDDDAARAAIGRLTDDLSLETTEYDRVLSIVGAEMVPEQLRHHAFVGLGLSHREPVRLNVYLKPVLATSAPIEGPRAARPVRTVGSAREGRLDADLSAGESFLVSSQSPSGAWLDFALPPGPSDGWVTAYVGVALSDALRGRADRATRVVIDRALAWSALAMRPDHRWGYNAFAESDADSSAWTILFLRANGWSVPDGCMRALVEFQRPDGRVATFLGLKPGDSWMDGHPDVTPIAIRALRSLGAPAPVAEARNTVVRGQSDDGSWPAFWWTSPWYSTWANLSLLETAGWAYDRARAAAWVSEASDTDARSAFEIALALRCSVLLADAIEDGAARIRRLADALCAGRLGDGSWPSVPMLRLTPARSHEPWSDPGAGRVFADPRRIFTTATVVAALDEARGALVARGSRPAADARC